MKSKRFTLFLLIISLAGSLLIVASCSTKKNTFTRRAYHNLTTHYNVYWNGRESYRNGVSDLEKNLRENYNKILPVVNYGSIDDARKIYSPMDRAIEKATIAIHKHSLLFRNKEYNRWIDDCYMLIGKAQFYKQDYVSAVRTFDFVMRQFSGKPVHYEAQLWMIRAYVKQKRYEEAIAQFEQLETKISREKVPFAVKRELPQVYADYYLQNDNLTAARTYLEQAIPLTSNTKLKVRIHYILAQISQKQRNISQATEHFTKVIKGPSSYEMAFNARINMAKSFDINAGNKAGLEKQLRKMAKESKNKDFRDQIYFALAELAQLDRNDTLVMHYLARSVATSVKNDFQKTTSSLMLADLYFNKQKYELAKAYYDTTLQVIPQDFPNYQAINTRTTTLSDLVNNLVVIQTEDSLQRVAALPEDQLNALIRKLIDEYVKEEQRKEEEERQRQLEMAMASNLPNMRNENLQNMGSGGWYFYNPSAISFGYTEFMRKWGRRKLEDNWRLSNKREVSVSTETETVQDTTGGKTPTDSTALATTKKGANDPRKPEMYLEQLPRTPQALKASNTRIADALVNAGYIYKDGLNNIDASIRSFEELLSRFPDYKDALRIYYQLFLIAKNVPDEALVTKYSDLILSKYPESDYALIIQNPEYNNELLARKNRALSLYEETYKAFTKGQYRMVLLYANDAQSATRDKELLAKFGYLKALSQGKLTSIDTMVYALNKLVSQFPGSTVVPLANELLQKYSKTPPQGQTTASNKPAEPPVSGASAQSNLAAANSPVFIFGNDTAVPTIYTYKPGITHFYILMLNEYTVNVNATKIRMSDFIMKNFSNESLTVNSIVLDGGWQMVTVSSFRNSDAALNFLNTVKQNGYVMGSLKDSDFRHFVISMENYPVFYREKKYDGYINFFNKFYLKQ